MKIITQRTVKREIPKSVKKPVPKKKIKKTEEPVIKPLVEEDNPFLTIDKEN